jgi:hypothetical protein
VRKAVGKFRKGEKPDQRERRRWIQGLREAERQIRGSERNTETDSGREKHVKCWRDREKLGDRF